MNIIMRYFDGISAPLFKNDAEGRPLFFPAGIWSKGRILPDEMTAAALRRRVTMAYAALFLIGIPILVVFNNNAADLRGYAMIGLGALAVSLLFTLFLFAQVRGLPLATERMTMKEAQQKQLAAMGPGMIKGLLVVSLLLAASSVAVLFFEPAMLWAGVIGLIMFGGCAGIFTMQLRNRSRMIADA